MRASGAQQREHLSRDSLAAALIKGTPNAVVIIDADRTIVEFNPSAEKLFGRSREEALGLDAAEALVPERFRQEFEDVIAGYLATGDRSRFVRNTKSRALRADGTERPVLFTPVPMETDGESYFFGIIQDATELVEARRAATDREARFRLLSELVPVGIMQTEVDGTCVFVNDRWTEMSGIPADEVLGQNWRVHVEPSDVRHIDAIRNPSAGPTELATDCRLMAADGGWKWVHVVVRRIEDGRGNLVGRVAALTDVNGRKLLEAARERDRHRLAEQNEELRGVNEARARYLATVSHELRTPLTSIVSFAELIRSESTQLDGDAGEYLAIIQRNAERLLRVVGDLLDLEGLEQGAARMELALVSVPEVTIESVRACWATAAADGIKLNISAEEGPQVRGDSGRLQQVLDNLIANAVKFSAVGGRVEVRATHDAREWRIDVADAGIGIPPGEVDHLFDRFFRASNAKGGKVPGTGLGLPTAKTITELHGGRIEVVSTEGVGTTFTVYLPIGLAALPAEPAMG